MKPIITLKNQSILVSTVIVLGVVGVSIMTDNAYAQYRQCDIPDDLDLSGMDLSNCDFSNARMVDTYRIENDETLYILSADLTGADP